MSEVANRLHEVRLEMFEAAREAGRDPADITLLAVSKTFPPASIREAVAAGQIHFGENRIQEAEDKFPQLVDLAVEWHLIGHLQSNKARRAVELFDVIHTLDSVKLSRRVGRIASELGKTLRVYAQVHIAPEEQKSGVDPEELRDLVEAIEKEPGLHLEGLMCLPPWSEDGEESRPYFRRLAQLQADLNQRREHPLTGLSMGMSNDFCVAIQEGSTLVRVGTSIFGRRGRPLP